MGDVLCFDGCSDGSLAGTKAICTECMKSFCFPADGYLFVASSPMICVRLRDGAMCNMKCSFNLRLDLRLCFVHVRSQLLSTLLLISDRRSLLGRSCLEDC